MTECYSEPVDPAPWARRAAVDTDEMHSQIYDEVIKALRFGLHDDATTALAAANALLPLVLGYVAEQSAKSTRGAD